MTQTSFHKRRLTFTELGLLLLGLAILGALLMHRHKQSHNADEAAAPISSSSSNDQSPSSHSETLSEEERHRAQVLRFHLQDSPHDYSAYSELRELTEKTYNERAVLAVVEDWSAQNTPDWETMLHLHTSCESLDDPEEAIKQEEAFLKRVPRRSDSSTWDSVEGWLAEDLLHRGRGQEALIHFQHQVNTLNRASEWLELADAQRQLGMYPEAVLSYEQALGRDPGSDSAHIGLAKAYAALDSYQEAETEAQAAISACRNSESPNERGTNKSSVLHDTLLSDLYRQSAQISLAAGQKDEAAKELDLAIKSNSDDYEAAFFRAFIESQSGSRVQADSQLRSLHEQISNLLAAEKSSSELKGRISKIENVFLLDSDKYPELSSVAIWYLEPQFQSKTLTPLEVYALGEWYCQAGKLVDCEALESTAIRGSSELQNGRAEHSLGLISMKVHNKSAAQSHFRRAYEYDPENLTYRKDFESDSRRLPTLRP